MILSEVDIIHLSTGLTFFYISSTVTKVSCYFALWKRFFTIIAKLEAALFRHGFKYFKFL